MATTVTAAPRSATAATPAESGTRRAVEFLLVGGATPLLFALSYALRRSFGLGPTEYAIGFLTFYGAHLINDPHFAVTYLLFYKNARGRAVGDLFPPFQRVRYLLAGFVVPLVLALWAAYALSSRSAFALGLLIQLMFFLVGWHYVKQGFGVMTVLAARRGVRFGPAERRVLLVHAFLGWAYAWASPFDPGRAIEEKGVVYWSVRHPAGLEALTRALCFASAAVVVVMLARKWRREGALPIVTPLTAFLVSVWTWSIYSSADPLVRYVIPALHSVQYLYFVWLLRRGEAVEREGPPWFETSARVRLGILAASALALGWVLFHGAPTVLDDLLVSKKSRFTDMGPTPYFAALYAFVNIHHYFMDFVIWRRENPETRYLTAV